MAMIGEATPGESPSPEKIRIYYEVLKDMDFEIIKNNAINYLRNKKAFFPFPCDLRNDPDPDEQAQAAFAYVEKLVDTFLYDGLQTAGMTAIKLRLEKDNKMHLLPLVQAFGVEVAEKSNITATRAQFLKAYKAERKGQDRKQIERVGGMTKIGDTIKGVLDSVKSENH